jgi:phage tail-like protein
MSDGSVQSTSGADSIWPLVRFQFKVTFANAAQISFQEVTGLSAEAQIIEYRAGDNPLHSTVKMPGIQKYTNVVLKKGMFKTDLELWNMFEAIKMNTFKRETITIHLLDESNGNLQGWVLNNAFPTKITLPDMKSDANETAVESLEIAYESISAAS